MEVTKIIAPKTDPEVVRQRAQEYIDNLVKSDEYNQMSEYNKKLTYIVDTWDTRFNLLWIGVFMIFVSIFFCCSSTLIYKIFGGIVIAAVMIFYIYDIYIFIKREKYEKLLDDYNWSLHKKNPEYMVSDVFDEDRFWNYGDLLYIEHIRKWAEMTDVSYIIKYDPEDYRDKDLYIYQCKDGQIIDKIHLFSWHVDNEVIDNLLKTPGTIDLSFMDDEFWAGNTPYYEKGENI